MQPGALGYTLNQNAGQPGIPGRPSKAVNVRGNRTFANAPIRY
jgi:hypothetical protein